jgi:hypothetical protein
MSIASSPSIIILTLDPFDYSIFQLFTIGWYLVHKFCSRSRYTSFHNNSVGDGGDNDCHSNGDENDNNDDGDGESNGDIESDGKM